MNDTPSASLNMSQSDKHKVIAEIDAVCTVLGVSQFIVCTQLGRFPLDKGNSMLLSVVNIVLRSASSHFNASYQSRNLPNCSSIQLIVELDIAL